MARMISPHFSFAEMTTTSTGLDNRPPASAVSSLVALATTVLEPWRALVGPLRVNSGYRSPAVNAAVRGSRTSDHMAGRAADVAPLATTLADAWDALVDGGFPVDQAIIYVRPSGRGWIHVSHRASGNRASFLVQPGPSAYPAYVPLADYTGPLVLP